MRGEREREREKQKLAEIMAKEKKKDGAKETKK